MSILKRDTCPNHECRIDAKVGGSLAHIIYGVAQASGPQIFNRVLGSLERQFIGKRILNPCRQRNI